jgi:hypothetical protein
MGTGYVARNPVHHLANIGQASTALGVFISTPAISELLLRFDLLQNRRTAVGFIVLPDIFGRVIEAIANQ